VAVPALEKGGEIPKEEKECLPYRPGCIEPKAGRMLSGVLKKGRFHYHGERKNFAGGEGLLFQRVGWEAGLDRHYMGETVFPSRGESDVWKNKRPL